MNEHVFIISTTADKARPGLTWKIEIPNWAVESWWLENKVLRLAQRKAHRIETGNTGIIHFDPEGAVEVMRCEFEWFDLQTVLAAADRIRNTAYAEDIRPGRPEKRVLTLTTSKERRTGSLVARQAF
jgi:hypothetical protein